MKVKMLMGLMNKRDCIIVSDDYLRLNLPS